MALKGPTPKDKPSRERSEKRREIPTTEVVLGEAKVKAPALKNAAKHHPRTRDWWKRWCGAPQASLFGETDWGRLQDLAWIMDEFYAEPTTARMAEIRLNEAKLGATIEDRLHLRIRFRDPKKDPKPGDEPAGAEEKPKRTRNTERTDPRLRLVANGGSG